MMFNPENKTSRLLSLDVFRGMTIILMILVNSPGNQTAYPWLSHSTWNGCTLADLVFPFFVFILGVSLVFSLSKSLEIGIPHKKLLYKILTRTIIIFLIGLFLNAFPSHFDVSTIRVSGVLQRIAICYFFASLLFLFTRIQTQILLIVGLLIGYWVIMTMLPVPDYGTNNLSPEGNLAAYIDRLILSPAHLYGKTFDPEGLLSTLPAIATTLIGNLAGAWLLSLHNKQKKVQGTAIAGVIALIIGWVWGLSFPINKSLWTSSYVLWSGGLALLLLATLYWFIEIKNIRHWSKIFEIFGLNAIAAYFLHVFFLKVQAMIHIAQINGLPGNLRIYITEHLFGWTTLLNASLLYAISYVILWFLVLTILKRNKIYIKI